MKRNKKYFDAFLNNPSSLSNREFHEKTREWVDFVKANPDKYELLGKGWSKARKRVEKDLYRRDDIRDEFDELDALMDEAAEADERDERDDAEQIILSRRWLEFMKKYQLEYEFTDEAIAETEESFKDYIKAVEEARLAEIKLQIAKGKAEHSVNKFADTVFKESDRLGKPVIIPDYKVPKRNQGN